MRKDESSFKYSGFTSPDNSDSPDRYIQYLDYVSNLQPIQLYKRLALDLLSIQKGDSVLGAGCGIGTDVITIAKELESDDSPGNVIGLDLSRLMLKEASRRTREEQLKSTKVQYVLGDLNSTPFADNTFDATRTDRTIQHFLDAKLPLLELVRVTKPGGKISLAEPDWSTLAFSGISKRSERAIQKAFTCRIPSPYVGRFLVDHLSDLGINDIAYAKRPIPLMGAEQIQRGLLLRTSVEKAVESGGLDKEDAVQCLEDFNFANPNRVGANFFIFTAIGYKPL